MKVGDKVYLYYDGKMGRETTGVIIRIVPNFTSADHDEDLVVDMELWADDGKRVTTVFRKSVDGGYGGWADPGPGQSIMRDLLGSGDEFGSGDWYSLRTEPYNWDKHE